MTIERVSDDLRLEIEDSKKIAKILRSASGRCSSPEISRILNAMAEDELTYASEIGKGKITPNTED